MNENVFLSLFCFFSRTQVREIRLRGSPRFRNKVGRGEKRSPPLCPRPMEITFRLCDKFAADYSRIVMIPSMRVVPSFIASQKFCKKKKNYYIITATHDDRCANGKERRKTEREKREQSGWKDDGEAREIIISGNRSTIDTVGGYIYSDEAKKDWRKREKDDRSFLE